MMRKGKEQIQFYAVFLLFSVDRSVKGWSETLDGLKSEHSILVII